MCNSREARLGALWYKNQYAFIDPADLPDEAKRQGYQFFRDVLVNRPTEFQALFKLFLAARRGFDTVHKAFTTRQERAVAYAIEALRMGKLATRYVAEKLGIGIRAAQRLLKRADYEAKMFAFGRYVQSVSKDVAQNLWTPKPEHIKRQMAAMPRICAGSGTEGCHGHTRGDYALCWSCLQKYGLRGEWEDSGVSWLLPEARRIEAEHRKAAINALYEDWRANALPADEAPPVAA
jgi:hypothetical protein